MSLQEQLSTDLKEAMRSGDAVRRTVIRSVMTAIKETEQRRREELVQKALKKHNVIRPAKLDDSAAMAAYEQAVDSAVAAEKVVDQAALDDSEVLGVIQRLVKQRQDSIAEAEKAGRPDIATAEGAELTILEGYLPAQMSREEIEAEARVLIAQVGAAGARDMGKVMGPLMAKLKGRADGKLISDVVKALLVD